MAAFYFDATDLLFYGLPAVLLVVGLGRSVRSNPKAALVYSATLAAWGTHWATQKYHAPGLPPWVRIEAPDHPAEVQGIPWVAGRSVLHLQAPTALEWTMRGDERRLDFSYGIVPTAYEQGSSDGCGFTVSLQHKEGSRILFHRLIQPRERPEDRGIQQTRLVLPPVAAGEVLRVAIDVGPNGNNSWDWAFLRGVGFTRSRTLLPAQFPSFQRLPDAANAPADSLFPNRNGPLDPRPPAPSVLEFVLRGGERRLRFRHGFLPGADADGQATAGARFSVRLQPATGPERTVWEHTLEPTTRIADRGPQVADLALAGIAAGDRLIVRVEPGAAGARSFNRTYVSSLSLE